MWGVTVLFSIMFGMGMNDGLPWTDNLESKFKLTKCYIKFINLGLSEQFDRIMNPGFLCNNLWVNNDIKHLEYMRGKIFVADKADIWSLCVVLFVSRSV